WNNVTGKRSYAIGGHGDHEFFYAIGDMGRHVTSTTCETCNTYNMLKLTRHLFCWQPLAGYADFYERALYNHILASQDPATGMMTYFVSLKAGHFKTYSTPEDSFWCCVGTGMENHAKYGEGIYFHDAKDLYVNLFIPSVLNWQDKGITVRQEAKYPEEGASRLTLNVAEPVAAGIYIRHPWWATQGLKVSVNGEPVASSSQPSSYVVVERTWESGDVIGVQMPMSLHLEPMLDDPSKVAVLYGPVVLAALLGKDGMPAPIVYAKDQLQYVKGVDPAVPSLAAVNGKPVEDWLKPTGAKPLEFKTAGLQAQELTLVPLYQVNDQRYTVYWDAGTAPATTAKT
ncbi:MAG: beta-L-arabinofuranosidase domain-containing protein, partial [Opitutales bacterium]